MRQRLRIFSDKGMNVVQWSSMDNADKLSPEETKTLLFLLSKFSPGFLPFDIFNEIARICVLAPIEVIPFRKTERGVEVLLTKRPETDPFWGGLFHFPGTIVRATDTDDTFATQFKRIFNDELKGLNTTKPEYFRTQFQHLSRGAVVTTIFWVEVKEEPKVGTFFPVKELPENIIEYHAENVRLAAEVFEKSKTERQ